MAELKKAVLKKNAAFHIYEVDPRVPSRIYVGVIDAYFSYSWADRFYSIGEFELFVLPNIENFRLSSFQKDSVIYKEIECDFSDGIMIIEKGMFVEGGDEGLQYKISGRSIEKMMDQRAIVPKVDFTTRTSYIDAARQLLLSHFSPSAVDPNRRIAGLTVVKDPGYIALPEYYIEEDGFYLGDSLDALMESLASKGKFGVKLRRNSSGLYVYSLYGGRDLSFGNTILTYYIEFSATYNNLLSSDYVITNENEKNVMFIAGEAPDADSPQPIVMVYNTSTIMTGVMRKEVYSDASSLKREGLTETQYDNSLRSLGKLRLYGYKVEEAISAQITSDGNYIYGRDYQMGDIVDIVTSYGISAKARFIEIIHSEDGNGPQLTPSMEIV